MSKLLNRANNLNSLYQRAEKHWSAGKLSIAFDLFLEAAKRGFVPAYSRIANFYDEGIGVKPNHAEALRWYMRAYREQPAWNRRANQLGASSVANNIGCILRDRGQTKLAIRWLQRAARLGDGDANLNIAKIYLRDPPRLRHAFCYLEKTCKADYVTDGSIEEARSLLRQLRRGSA